MSRFVFLGSAVFVGIMAVGVLSPHIHRAQETPAAAVTSPLRAADSPSPTPAGPIVAAAAPVQPRDGGTPIGLLVAAGLALSAAGVLGAGLLRLRRRPEDSAPALRHSWWCVLTAHTPEGVTEIRRGPVELAAIGALAVEREVVRRYEEAYGRPEGTGYACRASLAWPWVIYAGRQQVADGVVPLDEVTAVEAAVEVLGDYAAVRGLAYSEVLGLRCVVHGPDEVGEAEGRDW